MVGTNTQPPLPETDPAYRDLRQVLDRHHSDLPPPAQRQALLAELLDVIVEDRVRQAGPIPDASSLLDNLTIEQRAELGVVDTTTPPTVWVRSGVSPMGVYTTVIDFDDDHSRMLNPDEVASYVDTFLTAIGYAEYDAAVLNQLRNVLPRRGPETDRAVIDTVIGLRQSRRPLNQHSVRPLRVQAAVGMNTGEPYLNIRIAGTKRAWQWDRPDVLRHTEAVRGAMVAADMDAHYRRHLVGYIGLDDDQARRFVSDLQNWRIDQ